MSKSVYELELNETTFVGNAHKDSMAGFCRRVPGGWIYTEMDKSHNISSSVFVPFDNEFQEEKSK